MISLFVILFVCFFVIYIHLLKPWNSNQYTSFAWWLYALCMKQSYTFTCGIDSVYRRHFKVLRADINRINSATHIIFGWHFTIKQKTLEMYLDWDRFMKLQIMMLLFYCPNSNESIPNIKECTMSFQRFFIFYIMVFFHLAKKTDTKIQLCYNMLQTWKYRTLIQ